MEYRGLDHKDNLSMGKYDDIINMPHHVSKKYPQMEREKRAAQFAPFAALTGYDDMLAVANVENDVKIELLDLGIGDGVDDYYEYYK